MNSQPDSPSTSLCTSCGLCCDGTLFGHARLMPEDEVDSRFEAAATWTESDGRKGFLLPCHAFNGVCSVFPDRPQVCSAFRCKLLRKAERGAVSWERAGELVTLAKARRDQLKRAITEELGEWNPGHSIRREMQRVEASRGPDESDRAFRTRVGKVLVAHAALRAFLERHFLPQREKKVEASPMTARESSPVRGSGQD